jgi:hypothetical protein
VLYTPSGIASEIGLREAEVDVELTDQLGGWASSTIGQSYGSGHTLKQKYNAMRG